MGRTTAQFLSRKQAAQHLTALGYPIAPGTLEQLAWKKKGPPYTRFLNRIVQYDRAELERWAASQTTHFPGDKR